LPASWHSAWERSPSYGTASPKVAAPGWRAVRGTRRARGAGRGSRLEGASSSGRVARPRPR
jgi:hypothetical protein